jgi:hypothetical protein
VVPLGAGFVTTVAASRKFLADLVLVDDRCVPIAIACAAWTESLEMDARADVDERRAGDHKRPDRVSARAVIRGVHLGKHVPR